MDNDILIPLRKKPGCIGQYAVADIESAKKTWNQFAMIGLYDGESYKRFAVLDHFISEIEKSYAGKPVYLHYMDFDGMFLIDYLKRAGYRVFPSFAGSLLLRILFLKDGKKYEFRNSFNVLPASLKKLSKSFGEHEKVSLAKIDERNYWDCVSLKNIIGKANTRLDNCMDMTIAKTAMGIWRFKYLKRDIINNSDLDNIVFNAYKGGRVEIFGFNTDPDMDIHLYDVVSMYPYVMREYSYPCGALRKTHKHEKDWQGVCFCEIWENSFLPVVGERLSERTVYRNGHKLAWITTREYEYLKEIGTRVYYKYGFETPDCDFIFKEYVDDFFKMKSEAKEKGDKTGEAIAKLMLTSLYGKFGQKPFIRKYYVNPDEEFLRGNSGRFVPMVPDSSIGFIKEYHRASFIVPSIAAHVTANARLRWHSFASLVDKEIIKYGDTDSLALTEKALQSSRQLGMMELQGSCRPFYPIMPKFYRMGDTFKMKGIPRFEEDADGNEYTKEQQTAILRKIFMDMLAGKEFKIVRGIKKFRSAVRANKGLLIENEQTKSLKSCYKHREICDDERHTLPWHMYHAQRNRYPWGRLKEHVLRNMQEENKKDGLSYP